MDKQRKERKEKRVHDGVPLRVSDFAGAPKSVRRPEEEVPISGKRPAVLSRNQKDRSRGCKVFFAKMLVPRFPVAGIVAVGGFPWDRFAPHGCRAHLRNQRLVPPPHTQQIFRPNTRANGTPGGPKQERLSARKERRRRNNQYLTEKGRRRGGKAEGVE